MRCEEIRDLIEAALDGELDAAHAAQLERHLAACPDCAAARRRLEALRAAVRNGASYHRLPPGAADRLLAGLRAQAGAAAPAMASPAVPSPAVPLPVPPRAPALRPAAARLHPRRQALAAGIMLGLLAGGGLGFGLGQRLGGDREGLERSVVAAHIRALQPGHAFDVASSDNHTVKPWFDGKIDFSPPVKDLGQQGFALVGGRLDYVDQKVAAVMVYRRRQHQIDLFAWPGNAAPPVAAWSQDGYHVRAWNQDGFVLWAVSDLNESELDEFVRRWRAA